MADKKLITTGILIIVAGICIGAAIRHCGMPVLGLIASFSIGFVGGMVISVGLI